MDHLRAAEIQYRIEHQHGDGKWGVMRADPHDPSERDPERSWIHRRTFRCLSCDETVAVAFGSDDEPAARP